MTTVIIKQKKFQSTEQVQSYHKIVNIEIQSRKNEIINNDFKKRKIDISQKLKREQTFLWSKILFNHIVVCKRKRFEFFNISFLRKRAYLLSFIQNMINEVIEDLHYIRRYYENHSKTTFLRTYCVVVQIFLDFLKKWNDLNKTFYIYTSSSSKSLNEYENNSNIMFIFN